MPETQAVIGTEVFLKIAPGWLVNAYRAVLLKPRPDVRVLELKPTGGMEGQVDFSAHVVNYGTQQCRAEFSARVGEIRAVCVPASADLIPNTPPQFIRVLVPRPAVGDLVPALNSATTLFDEALIFEARAGKKVRRREWHEVIPDAETDAGRLEALHRHWRFVRGEETEHDLRTAHLDEILERESEEDDSADR